MTLLKQQTPAQTMHLYVWKKLGKKRWLFTVIFHNNNNLVWVSLSYAHYTLHREFTFAHIHRRCLLFLSSGIYTYLIRCHYHEIWSYLWVGVHIKRILIKIVCSPIWCLLVSTNCCVFLFVNKSLCLYWRSNNDELEIGIYRGE